MGHLRNLPKTPDEEELYHYVWDWIDYFFKEEWAGTIRELHEDTDITQVYLRRLRTRAAQPRDERNWELPSLLILKRLFGASLELTL